MANKISALIVFLLFASFAATAANFTKDLQKTDAEFNAILMQPKERQEKSYLKLQADLMLLTHEMPKSAEAFAQLARVTGRLALFRGGKGKVKLGRQIKTYGETALKLDP